MDDHHPPASIFPFTTIPSASSFDADMFADDLLSFSSSSLCFSSAGLGSDASTTTTIDWLTNPSLPFLLPPPAPDPFLASTTAGMTCRNTRIHVQHEATTFLQQQSLGFDHHHHHNRSLLSPPRMHPNLVTTLKSILSPMKEGGRGKMSTACEGGGGGGTAGAREEEEEGCGKTTGGGNTDTTTITTTVVVASGGGVVADATTPAAAHAAAEEEYQHHHIDEHHQEEEEEEATVVSVDLIKNRRPFTCSFDGCLKTFKNPQTMKMHFKTHYPGTDVCKLQRRNTPLSNSTTSDNDSTTTSNNNKHNKKIPSRCPLCRKTFVGLYELRRHFGRKHSDGEKSHGCRKCGKKFYIEVDLRDHEKVCGEPIQCRCGMKFAFKCNLVAHRKAHPQCQDHHHGHNSSNNGSGDIVHGATLLGPNPNHHRLANVNTAKSASSSLPVLNPATAAGYRPNNNVRKNQPFHDITNGIK